ncbi:uncharacterized protein G2W53_002172 [Senna tora]|uniref:Uncharacterized protein n=1 Tax=Senna tora TaxID=362788 RepID=A0A835CN82_9FABA|nr:uncharacterized protein G2W53_002172 [Senna tora]
MRGLPDGDIARLRREDATDWQIRRRCRSICVVKWQSYGGWCFHARVRQLKVGYCHGLPYEAHVLRW